MSSMVACAMRTVLGYVSCATLASVAIGVAFCRATKCHIPKTIFFPYDS